MNDIYYRLDLTSHSVLEIKHESFTHNYNFNYEFIPSYYDDYFDDYETE